MNLITSVGKFLGFGNGNNQPQNPLQNKKQKTNEYGTIPSEDMLPSTAFRQFDEKIYLHLKDLKNLENADQLDNANHIDGIEELEISERSDNADHIDSIKALEILERREKEIQKKENDDKDYKKDKEDLVNYTMCMEKIQAASFGFLVGVAAATPLFIYGSVTVAVLSGGIIPVIVAVAAVIFVSRKNYREKIEKEINLIAQKKWNVDRAVRLKIGRIDFLTDAIKKSPTNHHYRIARARFVEINNLYSPTKITINDINDPQDDWLKAVLSEKKHDLRRSR